MIVALSVAQSGSLFSADSWHDITFAAGEVRNPRRNLPLAMALGNDGGDRAVPAGQRGLPGGAAAGGHPACAGGPRSHGGAAGNPPRLRSRVDGRGDHGFHVWMRQRPGAGGGPRLLCDGEGRPLLRARGDAEKAHVPGWSLLAQGIWAAALVLPRTYNPDTHTYGNLYSNLSTTVISAAFAVLYSDHRGRVPAAADAPGRGRPYRVAGYPFVPALYILGAAVVLAMLFVYRPATTWPGLAIVIIGAGCTRYCRALVDRGAGAGMFRPLMMNRSGSINRKTTAIARNVSTKASMEAWRSTIPQMAAVGLTHGGVRVGTHAQSWRTRRSSGRSASAGCTG